ncbi:hypothetical protein WOLCODRAFT_166820 [Wolfiporia cocos MD-104 SS10]|uniref:BTB domain-containing protein n=1 Tax=Wolfiporia cocos (strain MD-104) TaxID=742152 RepID=A0A2H3J205_WOLCO|nr:hypothetical protein WOLCODRAFT_166820 [Wolfiporia cocos MD-104 SS10]
MPPRGGALPPLLFCIDIHWQSGVDFPITYSRHRSRASIYRDKVPIRLIEIEYNRLRRDISPSRLNTNLPSRTARARSLPESSSVARYFSRQVLAIESKQLRAESVVGGSFDAMDSGKPADTPESKISSPPFDREDADTVLLSSDGVSFRAHRIILTIASPFFQSMFDLPQSPNASGAAQVVPMSESSRVLDALLRFVYPVVHPTIKDFDLARDVLDAAIKYDIAAAIEGVEPKLRALISSDPLSAYAVACRHKMESLAKQAAICAVEQLQEYRGTFLDLYVTDFDKISAGCYHRLLQLQYIGARNVDQIGSFCSPVITCSDHSSSDPCRPSTSGPRDAPHPFGPRQDADIILESLDLMRFHVRGKVHLASASDQIAGLITEAEAAIISDSGQQGNIAVPIISLQEDSETIRFLLQSCLPDHIPDRSDMRLVLSVCACAQKYGIWRIMQDMEHLLSPFLADNPFRFYVLSCSFGFTQQALKAAKALLKRPIIGLRSDYVADLETIRKLNTNSAHANGAQIAAVFLPPGWTGFFAEFKTVVVVRPASSTLRTEGVSLIKFSRFVAACCSVCAESDPDNLYAFLKCLQQKVSDLITEVKLDL